MLQAGWVKALELPAKIIGGVFSACVLIYFLDGSGQLVLADIGEWMRPVVIIAGAVSGCLFFASIIGSIGAALGKMWQGYKQKKAHDKRQQTAISHLDKLSKNEVYIVCNALKEGSPSFTSWAFSSAAAQLIEKGLLIQHTGQFIRDYWPYTFHDFAWQEIEKRRDFFLEKEKELEAVRKRGLRR
jgi:hypothetical protein